MKIILFGSFARGDWVDDRISGYKSDYDILVIVNHDKLTDFEIWNPAEDCILHDPRIRTPVQFIVESKNQVNQELISGQYFYGDIRKDGIALYELKGHNLAEPRNLTPEEYNAQAAKHLKKRLPSAEDVFVSAQEARKRDTEVSLNTAAFLLHQATEHAYHAVLLTFTLYTPATHNIKALRGFAEDLDQRLVEAWPRKLRRDKSKFELLKRAYVEARYSEHYEISVDELTWLETRVTHLHELIATICEERLAKGS